MRSRPLLVTVAAILLVLLSLIDFPFPWEYLFPGAGEPPWFIYYPSIVLGVAGLIVAFGLWTLKPWSLWATVVVSALNFILAVPGVIEPLPSALRVAIAATAGVALLIVVLALLPASRRALRPDRPA